MPDIYLSKHVRGAERVPASQWAGDAASARFEMAVPTGVENNDVLDLGILPAYHTVREIILDVDELDDGTAMSIDVGLMTGTPGDNDASRTVGNEFFAADTTARTGGVARPTKKEAYRVAPSAVDRSIGVKIVAKATTAQAGVIGATVIYST